MVRVTLIAVAVTAASPAMAQQMPTDTSAAQPAAPATMTLAQKAAALSAAAAPGIAALKGLSALFKGKVAASGATAVAAPTKPTAATAP